MQRSTCFAAIAAATALALPLLVLGGIGRHATCDPGPSAACTSDERRHDVASAAWAKKRHAFDAARAGDVARRIAAAMPGLNPALHRDIGVLAEVIEIARTEHVTPPDEGLLIEGAIRGLERAARGSILDGSFTREFDQLGRLPAGDGLAADRALEILGRAIAAARAHSAGAVSDRQLIESGIHGMLAALDPQATYLSPKQWRDMQNHAGV